MISKKSSEEGLVARVRMWLVGLISFELIVYVDVRP